MEMRLAGAFFRPRTTRLPGASPWIGVSKVPPGFRPAFSGDRVAGTTRKVIRTSSGYQPCSADTVQRASPADRPALAKSYRAGKNGIGEM